MATASRTKRRPPAKRRKAPPKPASAPVVETDVAVVEIPTTSVTPATNGQATELARREAALAQREAEMARRETEVNATAEATAEALIPTPRTAIIYRSRKSANLQINRRPIERMTMRGGRASATMHQPAPFQFANHQLRLFRPDDIREMDEMLETDNWLRSNVYRITPGMKEMLAMKTGRISEAVALTTEASIRTLPELIQRAMDENDFPVVELQKMTKATVRKEFIVEWFIKNRRRVFPELMEIRD